MKSLGRQLIAIREYSGHIELVDTHRLLTTVFVGDDYVDTHNVRNIRNLCVIDKMSGTRNCVVLYKYKDGDYICYSNDYGNTRIFKANYSKIKENREKFIDIKFVGKGIHSYYGLIPECSETEEKMLKLVEFNQKASVLNLPKLNGHIDPITSELVCTGFIESLLKDTLIEKLLIPDCINKLQENLFDSCHIKKIKIGNNIKNIDTAAFAFIKELEAVEFGNKTEIIGHNAFYGCRNLKNLYNCENIKIIDSFAFFMTGIKEFNAWNNLKGIGERAFKASQLKTVNLGEALLDTIRAETFYTKTLEKIVFNKNLKHIFVTSIPENMNLISGLIFKSAPEVHDDTKLTRLSIESDYVDQRVKIIRLAITKSNQINNN